LTKKKIGRRFYLYFHERILGKLIGDDTFALPFWNWDAPGGMTLPAIYANQSSPLYDERRNPAHQPPFTLDLDYNGTDDTSIPTDQQIDQNLRIMYRQVIIILPSSTENIVVHNDNAIKSQLLTVNN